MDEDYISLHGPIEREGDRLVLRIPLAAGGDQLRLVCEGISEIDGEDLVVPIPNWLAEKIRVAEGTEIFVDDRGGKFNITKAPVH
jgi:hypothetical protein